MDFSHSLSLPQLVQVEGVDRPAVPEEKGIEDSKAIEWSDHLDGCQLALVSDLTMQPPVQSPGTCQEGG